MSDKTVIIIPTYNEASNVEAVAGVVFEAAPDVHILFVDDNSPDGTASLIEKAKDKTPNRVHIEKRAGKLGLGTAYIHGFRWAMQRDYDFVFEMDCDFSHNPNDLIRLRKELEAGYDLVIGSRYCRGGSVKNWPIKRILMSYFASVYVRIILLISIKRFIKVVKLLVCSYQKLITLNEFILLNQQDFPFATGELSYGFFDANGSSFPFQNGIILSTGKINNAFEIDFRD